MYQSSDVTTARGGVSCCSCTFGTFGDLSKGASIGDVAAVEAALHDQPLSLFDRGLGGLMDTAWHLAAANGHLPVLEALHRHVQTHLPLITKELTRRLRPASPFSPEGVMAHAVNQLNSKGQTPLMFACFAGKSECVELLLKLGANPWVQDNCGDRAALHYAALHGHTACIVAVLGLTPPAMLTRQVSETRNRTIKLVNQKTVSGFTPLHYAAYSRKPGAVQALLEREAAMLSQSGGHTAYDIITCPGYTTPLHVAAYQGFEEGAHEMLRFYLSCRDTGRFRDPRLSSDRASRLPYHVAGIGGHVTLAHLLHPSLDLNMVFQSDEVEQRGAPKLSLLAARALKHALLIGVDSADALIAQLPPLEPQTTGRANSKALAQARTSGFGLKGTSSATLHTLRSVAELDGRLSSGIITAALAEKETAEADPSSPDAANGNGTAASPEPQPSAARQKSLGQRLLGSLSRPWPGSISGATNAGDQGLAPREASVRRTGTSRLSAMGASNEGYRSPEAEPGLPGGDGSARVSRGLQGRGSRNGAPARHGGGRVEAEPDWWAAAPASPSFMLGMPTPADRASESVIRRSPSLMDRVRSIGTPKRKAAAANGGEAAEDESGRGRAALPGQLGAGASSNGQAGSIRGEQGSRGMGQRAAVSPFAAISWGTSDMVAALPKVDTCTVCLDDVYALVLVPCLHRLCAPCARRMVIAIKDKPMDCPVCRTHVVAASAPHDAAALEYALHLHLHLHQH